MSDRVLMDINSLVYQNPIKKAELQNFSSMLNSPTKRVELAYNLSKDGMNSF